MNDETLYIAINGNVLALDGATGRELWKVLLKPAQVMTLTQRGSRLIATGAGEVWCLDTATGTVIWHNPLKGLGLGFVSIAGAAQRGGVNAGSGGGDQAAVLAAMAGAGSDCSSSSGGCE